MDDLIQDHNVNAIKLIYELCEENFDLALEVLVDGPTLFDLREMLRVVKVWL